MSKNTYIAAVVVTCYVDGQRADLQPGEPVPELPAHDVAQLLAMGAIRDTAAEEAADKAAQRAARAAQGEFKAARSAVAAEAESIKTADH